METVAGAQIRDGGGKYFMCQIPSPLNGLFKHRAAHVRLDASVRDIELSLAPPAEGAGLKPVALL